jgi:hypothetical protein
MKRIKATLHWLAHRTGQNRGQVVSALDANGTVWIGFRCSQCSKISGIHATHPPAADKFS